MYDFTPIRQIRRIYASLLELGRLPAIADEINKSVAENSAAIRDLREIPRFTPSPNQSQPEAPQINEVTFRLDQFRSMLLAKLNEPLLCIDVGARWGADDALLKLKERAKLLCFDPDEEECRRIQAMHPVDEVEYVPLALSSDGRDLSLTITKKPEASSIFPPVEALHQHFPALDMMEPERVVTVQSTSLDKFLADRSLKKPDLFKLDTQGSELDILTGALSNLSAACMIDIEVEFNPLYHGQALFSDIDVFLRSQGFALWRLPLLVHYTPENFKPAETPVHAASTPGRVQAISPGNGQLYWGQAHYVRAECLITSQTPIYTQQAIRTAAIASAYGYWDLALMVLEKCAETKKDAATLRTLLK